MKRRKEHLVEKRDGRTEFMRSTKLARSIHRAMHSVGVDEDWRALELANVVLTALKERTLAPAGLAKSLGSPEILKTVDIADAVQHVLVVTGQPNAAVAYGALGAERARRHRALATLGRSSAAGTDTVVMHGVDRRGVDGRGIDGLGRE